VIVEDDCLKFLNEVWSQDQQMRLETSETSETWDFLTHETLFLGGIVKDYPNLDRILTGNGPGRVVWSGRCSRQGEGGGGLEGSLDASANSNEPYYMIGGLWLPGSI